MWPMCPPLLTAKTKPGELSANRRQASGVNQLHQVQDESNKDDEKAGVETGWRTCPLLCFTTRNPIIMHLEVSKMSIEKWSLGLNHQSHKIQQKIKPAINVQTRPPNCSTHRILDYIEPRWNNKITVDVQMRRGAGDARKEW
jgi:hypothetical protein